MIHLNRKFKVIIILILSFIICNIGFSQESRNPFKPQFPIIKIKKEIGEIIDEEPIIIRKKEKVFDVSQYRLGGVVWGEYSPRAIVNNRIYNIGDQLGEAEIIKIGKEGVRVNFNNKEYMIRTKNPFIKIEEEDSND